MQFSTGKIGFKKLIRKPIFKTESRISVLKPDFRFFINIPILNKFGLLVVDHPGNYSMENCQNWSLCMFITFKNK